MDTKDDTNILLGLTEETAGQFFLRDGPNELPSEKRQNLLTILVNVLREPMFALLIAGGLIYLLLGEITDSLMLLVCVFLIIGITFYQQRKTERALEALKNLSSPRALVIRNGVQKRIAGRDVVVGDTLILKEGDRIPADAVVITTSNLTIDESLLTGESLAVRKTIWNENLKSQNPGGDNSPFVFSGTLVVQGHGIARVITTGINTEMGKIGKALGTIEEEDTLLHKETAKIVRYFALIGAILCLLIVVIYGLSKGDWLNGILAGLTLSMSMIPEEFPVVLIIFLSLGAWRMSKRNVLTRKTSVIETLGAATVLCVDKTGTLTQNRMELTVLSENGNIINLNTGVELSENYKNVLEYAFLASQEDPFDPIEKGIKDKFKQLKLNSLFVNTGWSIRREYPISADLLTISHAWQSNDKKKLFVAAKGAPEAIFNLCHLKTDDIAKLDLEIKRIAQSGLRLIGVAKTRIFDNNETLPWDQHDYPFEFIGLLGFSDPIRPSVPEALSDAYKAGVRVIMITGDYPQTAMFIASEIGLVHPDKFLLGRDIELMDVETLQSKIQDTNIFARVVPVQKLKIVNALKANGEIVAMTGDGVNDAPALKAAHIGIAMGERGTDVAREAADLVLLDDDFSSIISAIKLGRRVYDNLKKAMVYILAVHVPIAGMSLLPVVLGLPVVLYPINIAFLELIIDPACSVVFESEPGEKGIMNRPPRNLKKPLFDRSSITLGALQGVSVLLIVFLVYLQSLYSGKSEMEARTLSFVSLILPT